MKIFFRKRRGFTLIEMTVVLFIISLLILIIVPNISKSRDKAKTVHQNAMVSVIQSQVDSYLDDNSSKDKNNETVTLDELSDKHYLTPDQVNKAEDENIEISNNHAQVKNSDNNNTSNKKS